MTHISENIQLELAALRQRVAELECENNQLRHTMPGHQEFFLRGPVVCFKWLCAADWSVAYVSPNVIDLLGLAADELTSGRIRYSSVVHPDDLERVASEVQTCSASGVQTFEQNYRMLHADGTIRHIYNFTVVLRDDQGSITHYYGYILDISERVRLEQSHTDQMQIFTNLIDTLPFPVFYKNADGVYLGCNRAFTQDYLGKRADAIVGKSLYEVFPYEQADFYHRVDTELLHQGGIQIYERDLTFADNATHTIMLHKAVFHQIDGTPGGIVGALVDISERKRSEEELRMSQFALDHASDAIEWVAADGHYIYVNETASQQSGYTREELLTMHLTDMDPNFPLEKWSDSWNHLKEAGSLTFETIHRRKDGTLFPVEVSTTYLEFQGQEVMIGFVRDISERKRSEAERESLHQQIIAAQEHAIRELSVPLLPLLDQVVVVPLIGNIDSNRAQQVMESLLEGIAARQAHMAIIDITGVQVVDTQVAQTLIRTAQATRLLGAQVILTGIQPQIAQTLVHLGANLQDIVTPGSLQDGIDYALRKLSVSSSHP